VGSRKFPQPKSRSGAYCKLHLAWSLRTLRPADLRAAGNKSAACDWRTGAGWDNELGSVGRGDWPGATAVRMQTGCSGAGFG
jgi:hypothetical protein